MTDPSFELFVDGVDFGEGPRWRDGHLWYSDFYQHAIYTVTANGERSVAHGDLADQPSGLGWLPDGRLLVVFMQTQQLMVEDGNGGLEPYADLSPHAAYYCNDMLVTSDGHAYVGEFGFDIGRGEDFATANLIHVAPDQSVSVAAPDMQFPNGTVTTTDEKTLIVGESFGGQYVAFDRDKEGLLTNRRVWATVPDMAPDGCTIDADGAIWFADARSGDIVRVLEGGEITDRVTPPQRSFACMLGGHDGKQLFVLTSPSSDPRKVTGTGAGAIYMYDTTNN